MSRSYWLSVLILIAIAFPRAHADETPGPAYVPYHASGIYELGDTVGWKVTLPSEAASATYVIRKNNREEIGRGVVRPGPPAKIETTLNEQSMPWTLRSLACCEALRTGRSPLQPYTKPDSEITPDTVVRSPREEARRDIGVQPVAGMGRFLIEEVADRGIH
jgi:hypothetical protein